MKVFPGWRRPDLPLVVLMYLFCWIGLSGQSTGDLQFTNFINSNGLPSNIVAAICQDNNGFIWMGTNDGLSRFDGRDKFTVFKTTKRDTVPNLQSDNIVELYFSKSTNVLWVGTRLGGLSRLNLETDKWKTYLHDPADPTSISNDEILSIVEDNKGRIWIGTENGLNLLDENQERFTRFMPDDFGFKGSAILSLFEDANGWLWMGTWSGGLYLVTVDGFSSEFGFREILPEGLDIRYNTWNIFQDNQNRFWIGDHGGGLLLVQLPSDASNLKEQQEWEATVHVYQVNLASDKTISNNFVQTINMDAQNRLMIGSTHGFSYTDPLDNFAVSVTKRKPPLSFYREISDVSNSNSIVDDNINQIFIDEQGLVWIATDGGASQYNNLTSQFSYNDLSSPSTGRNVSVNDLYLDSDSILWLASYENEFVQYDLKSQTLKHLKSTNPHSYLNRNESFVIFSGETPYLHIVTSEAIVKYDLRNKKEQSIEFPDWVRESKFAVTDILIDKAGVYWITGSTGLLTYDEKQKQFLKYTRDLNDPNSLSDNSVNDILEDESGNIWIATYNGLNLVRRKDGQISFQRFISDLKEENSISSNRIISLEDHKGTLYCGTTSGMCAYKYGENKFVNYDNKLIRKYCVTNLFKDNNDVIWGAGTEGIFSYNTENENFNFFDRKDGIEVNDFGVNSFFVSKSGEIYIGNNAGFTSFHPSEIKKNEVTPKVFITKVETIDSEKKASIQAINTEKIELDHSAYFVSFDFATTNYNRFEKNQFAYKLEGFDKEWKYTTKATPVVYTNLAPGEYIFRVKAANNDGLWNEEGAKVELIIYPAFWQTRWFPLVLIGMIGLLFWYYTYKIKKRSRELELYNDKLNLEISERKKVEAALQEREQYMEDLVKERTKELELKNKEVENLLSKIKNKNEKLESIVELRTKKLKESNLELLRSNKELENFAYIASHDLQEPLRTISNFTGLLGKRYRNKIDSTADTYLNFVEDGAKRMSWLIHSLLTYSKVGRDSLRIQKVQLNEILELKLRDLSSKISERKAIVSYDDLPVIDCEKDQLGMIFYNLINNAIKFNKAEIPTVHISWGHFSKDHCWLFSVQDNGIGIQKEYRKKIFEIFSRLHNYQEYEGTGIGLALCQKIVTRHRGKIWFESEMGKGTTFHFTINKNLGSNLSLPAELIPDDQEN